MVSKTLSGKARIRYSPQQDQIIKERIARTQSLIGKYAKLEDMSGIVVYIVGVDTITGDARFHRIEGKIPFRNCNPDKLIEIPNYKPKKR